MPIAMPTKISTENNLDKVAEKKKDAVSVLCRIPPRPSHDPPPPPAVLRRPEPPRSSTGEVLPKAAPPGLEAPPFADLVLNSHIRFEKNSVQKTNMSMQCKDAKSYVVVMPNCEPPSSDFPDGYLRGGFSRLLKVTGFCLGKSLMEKIATSASTSGTNLRASADGDSFLRAVLP